MQSDTIDHYTGVNVKKGVAKVTIIDVFLKSCLLAVETN